MIFKKLSQGPRVFDVVSVASSAEGCVVAFSRWFSQEFSLNVNIK